jgi:hypothetical protein
LRNLSLTFLLLLCSLLGHAQPKYFRLKPMEGYFLENKIPLKQGPNFFVITNRQTFIKYFGVMNKPDTPRFDYDNVIVMALPPSKKFSQIGFMPQAARAGNFIEVYCVMDLNKYPLTYMSYPVVAARIPKYFSVTRVNFYSDEKKKLMETVYIK